MRARRRAEDVVFSVGIPLAINWERSAVTMPQKVLSARNGLSPIATGDAVPEI